MVQKKTKILERQQEVINGLHDFGSKIYDQLAEGVFPTINMLKPLALTQTYDLVLRQYILGEKSVSQAPATSAT